MQSVLLVCVLYMDSACVPRLAGLCMGASHTTHVWQFIDLHGIGLLVLSVLLDAMGYQIVMLITWGLMPK